ncbi:MAG: hypothetical protein F6K19_29435 [Cyanothece sp. SIO1E1]|nr:hypothetical protein [Cyanothece sp. SIO1E1]
MKLRTGLLTFVSITALTGGLFTAAMSSASPCLLEGLSRSVGLSGTNNPPTISVNGVSVSKLGIATGGVAAIAGLLAAGLVYSRSKQSKQQSQADDASPSALLEIDMPEVTAADTISSDAEPLMAEKSERELTLTR